MSEDPLRANGHGLPRLQARRSLDLDDVPAAISPKADATIEVEFRSPQRSVAPGQSVVVYDRDRILGGARIVHAFR